MSETEYLKRRLNIAESALRYFVMELQRQMPPHSIDTINDIGQAWNRELDKLEAERATHQPAAHASDKGENDEA